MPTIQDFEKLDIRLGQIIQVSAFPEAKKPAYKLQIDFGNVIGIKKSSAQLVENYQERDLVNRKVLAVINFPPLQIGPFISEVLVLGVPDEKGNTVLVSIEKNAPLGSRLY